jgi:hypothetical protein
VLTFQKTRKTGAFPAAFQRLDPAELAGFPGEHAVRYSAELIRKVSPDALSIMELGSNREVALVEKMLRHPPLKHRPFRLASEFHMTQDAGLFRAEPGPGRLPLHEGKMVWQFDAAYAPPRFWLDERAARRALLRAAEDRGQSLPYEQARMGIRAVASNTNERSLIAALLPPRVFGGNSLLLGAPTGERGSAAWREAMFLLAVLNSFVVDAFLRRKVTANINMFYLYELPVPPTSEAIAELADLDEEDLSLVLAGFPIVSEEVKQGVRTAFRRQEDPA